MVVDEFDVNGDGKGKKCHQLKKKSQHEFAKKSLLVSEKNIFPLNLNKPYKFLSILYI
jgi:hypothetical protein